MIEHLEQLINSLYEMVQDSWTVPFGGDKCMIERDRVLDILDELRMNMPSDVKMANEIVEKRNDLIAAGKREAEAIVKQAEDTARQMINETEIVQQSRRKAKEIIGNAEIQSRELRRIANDYCEDILKRAEESAAQSLEEIKKARARFRASAK